MMIHVLEYLEETAKRFPEKIAIKEEKSITFKELEEQAKKIGTALYKKYQETNRPIVTSVDRNLESILLFLGVLYSGNYYVPVDSSEPKERFEQKLEVLNPLGTIGFHDEKSLSLEELLKEEKDEALLQRIREKHLSSNPCYVLFTSGSTGTPKGVVISHAMVLDLTEWLQSVLHTTEADTLGNQTPFFFDASVKDIYQMLKTGATMVILKPQLFAFPKRLLEVLNEEKVTLILWASSALSMVSQSEVFSEQKPEYLRLVTFAGEQLPTKHLLYWRTYLPEARFINLYGPTETTVDCLYHEVKGEISQDMVIPLGKPCRNKFVFLINDEGKIITEGTGELVVAGSGVGLGYFGDKEKTEASYIQNPKHNLYRDIVYKTGDLAYLNEEGDFVFASRKDDQIKLQGHRIELGEIESSVRALDEVQEAVCVFKKDLGAILCYYTGTPLKRKEMALKLLERIPKYMIPHKFIHLETFPMTPNGKIDRVHLKSL